MSSDASTAAAVARAHARYWSTVAPEVRVQLARWHASARAISEPALRDLALRKLRDERFNVEVAATLATLAPRNQRKTVVTALAALQIAYDYLDLLTESPLTTGRREATLLALADAVAPASGTIDAGEGQGQGQGQGQGHDAYLTSLVATVKSCLDTLPAAEAVRTTARHSAQRCAKAQALRHAAEAAGGASPAAEELSRWAATEAAATGLRPLELIAGATASVLCMHALIAAAADPTTDAREARRLDRLYLSIGVLSLLDNLIDAERDDSLAEAVGEIRELSANELAQRLLAVAWRASEEAGDVAHSDHHRLTLAGVIAYYGSAPSATNEPARAVLAELERELHGLLTPALWTLRAWRAAKSKRLVSSAYVCIALRRACLRVCAGSGARAKGVGRQTPPEGGR